MSSNNINPLDKAVNLRQLKMEHDAAMHFAETDDPASEEVIDEYQRTLDALYQALEDAQQVVTPAQTATEQANEKALLARQAAANADAAASAANRAAGAATEAAAQVEDASGGYSTLSDRLDATQMGLIETSNPMTLVTT